METRPHAKDPILEIAHKIVDGKSYVLGGVLRSEISRLKISPEETLPFNEAAELVPTITGVDFLPFQSGAFRLDREGNGFTGQIQYTSSANITEEFPFFHPQNLLGDYSNPRVDELKAQIESVIRKHKDIWDAYAELKKNRLPQSVSWDLRYAYEYAMYTQLVDHGAQPEETGKILSGNNDIMILEIPGKQKLLLRIPAGENASSRLCSAVLLFDVASQEEVKKLANFVEESSANGLNALFAILLSAQLAPTLQNLGSETIGRNSLFYCGVQQYDQKKGRNRVLRGIVELVPGKTSESYVFAPVSSSMS